MSGSGLVELVCEEPGWTAALPELEEVAEVAARAALAVQGLDPGAWQIALLACDDSRIAALNSRFRARTGPTNVLSWPAFDLAPAAPGERPALPSGGHGGPRRPLGDVAIALQTTAREAEESGISLKDHVIHLILHGCLHLLGFDHRSPEDAETMEGIETRALARLGVADPYSQRDACQPHPGR